MPIAPSTPVAAAPITSFVITNVKPPDRARRRGHGLLRARRFERQSDRRPERHASRAARSRSACHVQQHQRRHESQALATQVPALAGNVT